MKATPCPYCGKYVFPQRKDCNFCHAIFSTPERQGLMQGSVEMDTPAVSQPTPHDDGVNTDNPALVVVCAVLVMVALVVWFGVG